MKKILFFGNSILGLKNFRMHLMLDFKNRGYHVLILAPEGKLDIENEFKRNGFTFIPIRLNRTDLNLFKNFGYFWQVLLLMRKERPDIIINYTIKPVLFGTLAGLFAGVKSIYSVITGLGYVFLAQGSKARVIRAISEILYYVILRFNKKIFFLNPDDLAVFTGKKLVKRENSVLLDGEGVDTSYYESLPLPENISFLFGGRLLKDKGVCEYVEAARILKQGYPQIKFKLVGDFDDNPAGVSKEYVGKAKNNGIIDYLGYSENIRDILLGASVLVLPSYREGTPRVVLEAMAVGRPIITSDAPGCRETVVDGINGFLVPVKNVAALVDAMKKIILSPALIPIMGAKSRSLAVEKYDVRKVNQIILHNTELLI